MQEEKYKSSAAEFQKYALFMPKAGTLSRH